MASLPLGVRVAVFVRDKARCVYCGATYQNGARLSVDHVISRKRGGSDLYDNLVCACLTCNKDKAHFSLGAYLYELRDRGQDTAGIAERVEAQRLSPIDWAAVERASAELKLQARMARDEDE